MTTGEAISHLTEAIQEDEMYAWSWQCNIAMCAVDEGVDHHTANRAAARFMKMLFDVDVTETEMWEGLKENWRS